MATTISKQLIEKHEGNERYPYHDTMGKLTIGVGFNLDDVGLFPEEVDFILTNRIRVLDQQLKSAIAVYTTLPETRQAVLVDMAYNMGLKGLLTFHRFLDAVDQGDYLAASKEMLNSLWAIQVGNRAKELADIMRTGTWESSQH